MSFLRQGLNWPNNFGFTRDKLGVALSWQGMFWMIDATARIKGDTRLSDHYVDEDVEMQMIEREPFQRIPIFHLRDTALFRFERRFRAIRQGQRRAGNSHEPFFSEIQSARSWTLNPPVEM